MDIGAEQITKDCRFCLEEFSYWPSRHGQGRMTMRRKRTVCDKCRQDNKRVARIKKYGPQAKDWPSLSEMKFHLEREHVKNYIFGLTMIPPSELHYQWERAWPMPENECEHGRLKGDVCPSPRVEFTSPDFRGQYVQNWPYDHPCGCWGEEDGKVPERPNGPVC